MNDSEIDGPVMLPAVDAVIVKMPAAITTDTPKTIRSHQVRSLRSCVSGSSVSAIDCSTDLVRQSVQSQPSESLSRIPEVHFSQPFRRGVPSTVVIHGADYRTRDHHRGQPGRFVRRTCAVGFL